MARRRTRMDLIREAEAAAAATKAEPQGEAQNEAPKAAGKAAPVRKPPRAKKKPAASGGGGREKAVWGVFDSSFKRVALFEWRDRALADGKARELGQRDGSAYVVRPARVPMEG